LPLLRKGEAFDFPLLQGGRFSFPPFGKGGLGGILALDNCIEEIRQIEAVLTAAAFRWLMVLLPL
jgi:hypothetical protein